MFSLLMASNRRHSTRTRKIREKKQQTKKNYITIQFNSKKRTFIITLDVYIYFQLGVNGDEVMFNAHRGRPPHCAVGAMQC